MPERRSGVTTSCWKSELEKLYLDELENSHQYNAPVKRTKFKLTTWLVAAASQAKCSSVIGC